METLGRGEAFFAPFLCAGKESTMSRPWTFLLPACLNPALILPPSLCGRGDEARYLVNCIVRGCVSGKADAEGFVRLRSELLRKFVNWRALKPVIDALEACGVISIDHSYSKGGASKGYRLGPDYVGDTLIHVMPTKSTIIKAVAASQERWEQEQARRCRGLEIYSQMNEIQHRCLTVCMEEALSILPILEAEARCVQAALLGNIQAGCMTNSVGKTGRWFNGLSNVSRKLRHCLRIDGQTLVAIDLTSCQPALLAYLAESSYVPTFGIESVATYKHVALTRRCPLAGAGAHAARGLVVPAELARFRAMACDGPLYDWLALASGLLRADAKREFLVAILSPKRIYPCACRSVMEREFPSLMKFIKHVNRDDHGELIRTLQRLESWLVIENVAPKLVGKCNFVPLHDAIYCKRSDLDLVRAAFEETFEEIQFQIAMKEERCGTARMPALAGVIA
jgi:hypothetical protein